MSLKDKLHVLVVDDMSTSRGLIVQALDSIGIIHIRHTASGAEAIELLARQPAHLVLSDYNMPGMDGIELLRQIRANPSTKGTGFILITGKADKAVVEDGKSLGMNNFIRKPFDAAALKTCLEAVVGRL
ncbi:two-component system, chemotaxis family, response regulator CheY [Paracoccus isoporae]|uniref:Two-component system, chemotaxis family, response regulator CheY n=1 Tax=Paracoccus isoporae TaxID=591205 RepID=A0A1G6WC93_9RHOB|nr:response regulator [Paracoccus isoporae]SDD63409.1 two-component system, chemotaxis family, response regulator CheY [Paracoccus isoporae]